MRRLRRKQLDCYHKVIRTRPEKRNRVTHVSPDKPFAPSFVRNGCELITPFTATRRLGHARNLDTKVRAFNRAVFRSTTYLFFVTIIRPDKNIAEETKGSEIRQRQ
jgi:hypothetical protein